MPRFCRWARSIWAVQGSGQGKRTRSRRGWAGHLVGFGWDRRCRKSEKQAEGTGWNCVWATVNTLASLLSCAYPSSLSYISLPGTVAVGLSFTS